jgi:hypothetical protein
MGCLGSNVGHPLFDFVAKFQVLCAPPGLPLFQIIIIYQLVMVNSPHENKGRGENRQNIALFHA